MKLDMDAREKESVGVYNNREPGGVVAQREMQDSFRLRNMIYVCEDDSRTHLCEPWVQRDAMALYGVRDSLDTLKRDFARDLCEDIHGWWFDMGPGWYDDPQILALFARQQEIAREAYAHDRTKRNDIALVYDTERLHHVSQTASQLVLDFWRTAFLRQGCRLSRRQHASRRDEDMVRPPVMSCGIIPSMNAEVKIDCANLKPLPVGDSEWAEFSQNSYAVDKTLLIKDILDDNTKVALFTRPQRFGKTTAMKMLKAFVEVKAAKSEADDLKQLAQDARDQIDAKNYVAEMAAQGVTDVMKLGLAFYRKNVELRER